ncbi:RecQ family ATP-dependent DNA helicase [Metabacillus arenae]|uniref:ATP-dependent DNA helicase RecQ n=1 Tax=Metabacillus arenae TaxID=2771434 RepID=A0A926RVY4_9BACI|nr:ATP-dependent DNA helicase RecQ [Metabacillus arenae]MBD1378647.1 ATP-dependent DNA helicase RecQ [Metabacillus arenae]
MLETVLHKRFGYSTFRPKQKEIIEDVIANKNVIAMLPTGTGKSLCYQLPGYFMNGTVLIVSPLLSLMQDQVQQMKQNGEKSVAAINSLLSYQERKQILRKIDQYKFLFVSPEILQSDYLISLLKQLTIDLFVVDEAHCISQWGHDFRPDYSKLGEIRKALNSPVCLALTATATKEIVKDIKDTLKLEDCEKHILSVDRPNISISLERLSTVEAKLKRVNELVSLFQGPGIVYCSSRTWTEKISRFLKEKGHQKVAYYHAGLDQEQRILTQNQFIQDQLEIICCTTAFGMGINKQNVRYIIHFHIPSQIEAYLQEIGRAGRDGLASVAVLLISQGDQEIPRNLIEAEIPDFTVLEQAIKTISLGKEREEVLLSSLTETQARFVLHLLGQFGSVEGSETEAFRYVRNHIEKRLQIKYQKLSSILDWTQSNSCRRKGIVSYFDENSNVSGVQDCCDQCGLDYRQFYRKENFHSEIELEWKEELKKIFHQSE